MKNKKVNPKVSEYFRKLGKIGGKNSWKIRKAKLLKVAASSPKMSK
jgi:hypothetical protein